jgi:hypothetical protein
MAIEVASLMRWAPWALSAKASSMKGKELRDAFRSGTAPVPILDVGGMSLDH